MGIDTFKGIDSYDAEASLGDGYGSEFRRSQHHRQVPEAVARGMSAPLLGGEGGILDPQAGETVGPGPVAEMAAEDLQGYISYMSSGGAESYEDGIGLAA